MEVVNINVRVDKPTKTAAEAIFNSLGLNMTTAITLFLRQTIMQNGIPFDLKLEVPNAETLEAFEEGDRIANDPNAKHYSSIEELREALGV